MTTRRARRGSARVAAACAIVALAACTHTTAGRPAPQPPPASASASASATASGVPSGPTPSRPNASTPSALDRFYGREWNRLPTTARVVALTFDAGGDDAGVASILATLAAEKVPGTFFLTGAWVQRYPAEARSIAAQGRVADHSMTHPHFTALTDAQMRNEVLSSAALILQTCDSQAAPFFRFPFGDHDDRTIDTVNSLGYIPIGWTVDTLGWEGTSRGITVYTVVSRVLSAAQPGEIVLMHVGANPDDGSTLDAGALARVIDQLRARGYTFVSIASLLTMTP